MGKTNYAAIDIGSNAVRLLIKGVENDFGEEVSFKKLILLRVALRLGFDVFTNGRISDDKAIKLKRLMKAFKLMMKVYDVKKFKACATSAMRDAVNGDKIIQKIEKSTGIEIEIIDGSKEANIIFNNHAQCHQDRSGNFLYVDVGGGSTELNMAVDGRLVWSKSYNIGTIRILTNRVGEGIKEKLDEDLKKIAEEYQTINLIGSGGNINKLYKMVDKKDKKQKRIAVSCVKKIYEEMKVMSLEERMENYSMKVDRADVIVPACEIFLAISEAVKAQYIHVPTIGLSDGIIDILYDQDRLIDA